ncbi:hypothetical protein V6N13_134647 [Hibiscus sabdariffa]
MEDVCGVTPVAGPNDVHVGTSRDSNELYGPWMQVVDRRRRVRQQVKDVFNRDGGSSGPAEHRSRFAVLADVPENKGIGSEKRFHDDPVGATMQNSFHAQQSDVASPTRQHTIERSTSPVRNREANVENDSVTIVENDTARRVTSPPDLDGMASSWKVVMVKSILRADKNVAIRVLEPGFKPVSKEEWQLVIRHVPRHQNSLADRLAALGRSASCNGLSLLIPPADLVVLAEEEKVRSACGLLISEDWATSPNVACFNLHVDPGG